MYISGCEAMSPVNGYQKYLQKKYFCEIIPVLKKQKISPDTKVPSD